MCIRPDSGRAAGAVAGLLPLRPPPAPLASGCLVRADEYVHPVLDINLAVTRAVVQALDERKNVTGRRLPVGAGRIEYDIRRRGVGRAVAEPVGVGPGGERGQQLA